MTDFDDNDPLESNEPDPLAPIRARLDRKQLVELWSRERWGSWSYNWPERDIEHRNGFRLGLSRLTTSSAILDVVAQASAKPFFTAHDIGTLVRILDDLLRLQANVCGGGIGGNLGQVFNPVELAELNLAAIQTGTLKPEER